MKVAVPQTGGGAPQTIVKLRATVVPPEAGLRSSTETVNGSVGRLVVLTGQVQRISPGSAACATKSSVLPPVGVPPSVTNAQAIAGIGLNIGPA